MPEYKLIRFEQIQEPQLPARVAMDEERLYELRDSIKAIGIISPLVVVQVGPVDRGPYPGTPEGSAQAAEDARVRYEIVAGHRRYKASQMVPLAELPCMVYESRDLAEQAVMLHENVCREDLSPFEEATFLAELIEKFDCTEEQLCRLVHKGPDYVNDRLAIMRYDEKVREALRDRRIKIGVARELQRCKDVAHLRYLLDLALDDNLKATAVRSMVNQFHQQPEQGPMPRKDEIRSTTISSSEPSVLFCYVCGASHDPQNLMVVYVHRWEWEGLKRAMAKVGVVLGERVIDGGLQPHASD